MSNLTDFNINELFIKYPEVLKNLLYDNSSKKYLIFATSLYLKKGPQYKENDQIYPELIIMKNDSLIKPRIIKSKNEQLKRSKEMAEVFTPSWVCNAQNNLIDEVWFNKKNVFNLEGNKTWITNYDKILFENNTWQDYILANRMEITCGEAPYLVSRYDMVDGKFIEVKDRIGLLDRKLRVVNENTSDDEWYFWVKKAFQHIYGYDFQGDNIFLARANLLISFIEYYNARFNSMPTKEALLEIAEIISWNIWQMDGLKGVIPNSCTKIETIRYNLFDEKEVIGSDCPGCKNNTIALHNGIKCKIMDWDINKKIDFHKLIKGGI